MICPDCATQNPEDDLFCENCGLRLTPADDAPATTAQTTCTCGATTLDEEGFCLACGRRVLRPPTDHIEQAISETFAAVSDRGLRHEKNEDRFAILETAGHRVLVVADGVSTSHKPEFASATVSAAVADYLAIQLATDADPETLLRDAIAAAQHTLVAAAAEQREPDPSSTTVVAALVTGSRATIAWVGDSRAYWISPAGAEQLTTDHSWLNDITASGALTLAQAENSPQAHAITHWLGADSDEHATPGLISRTLTAPGTLLLITDGIWNYAEAPTALATLLAEARHAQPDALSVARHLVEFANRQGGRDNSTAALLFLDPPAVSPPEPPHPDVPR